jgi:hypothetical protein
MVCEKILHTIVSNFFDYALFNNIPQYSIFNN